METQAELEPPPVELREPTSYFTGQMPPVRLSGSYKFALFAVALAMVLLPVCYLGFIGLVGWGAWVWATRGVNMFFPVIGGTRRVFWMMALVYAIPLLVAFILILFMLKSFFSRWRIVEFAAPISHLDHPQIFRFLGQLCQQMGAPIPSRVDVTMAINASAGFRAGFGSLFGNDIMLTFGLPLVASMSCREFAAVMAHELGHFTQRSAMRCDFIIRTVHGWLFRAVYERDEFDLNLEDATSESAVGLVIGIFAHMAIACTRGLMWLLLVLGHALTSFLSRQMEFHADACAAAVAGTDGFVAMLNKLRVLNACFAQAALQFKHQVAPKYPDDLSTYLAVLAAQCSGQMQAALHHAAAKEKNRWYQSHPPDAEREQCVILSGQPGIITDSRPATLLFNGFPELSRNLTLASYRLARRRKPISPAQVFHVEPPATAAEAAPDTSGDEALIKRYFCGLGLVFKPLLLSAESRLSAGLASSGVENLNQARATLEQADLLSHRESLKQLDARMLQALEANALAAAGLPVDPESFPIIQGGNRDLLSLLNSVRGRQEQLARELEPFEQAARLRLLTALNLLRTPAVAARIPATQSLHDEVLDLIHVFGKLSAAFPPLLELRKEFAVLQTLLGAGGQFHSEQAAGALSQSAQRCNQRLAEIQAALGSAGYPFEHPKGRISVADYARARQFDSNPSRMAQLESQSHLQMLFALYYRLLGRLAYLALQVEAQVGGAPLNP
jgi:Zn-dependent protease with chaperone function